jgi:hypothetical protein
VFETNNTSPKPILSPYPWREDSLAHSSRGLQTAQGIKCERNPLLFPASSGFGLSTQKLTSCGLAGLHAVVEVEIFHFADVHVTNRNFEVQDKEYLLNHVNILSTLF